MEKLLIFLQWCELERETLSAYATDKRGLKSLAINICSELGGNNIQYNGLCLDYIAPSQTAPLKEIQKDGSKHTFDIFIISRIPT